MGAGNERDLRSGGGSRTRRAFASVTRLLVTFAVASLAPSAKADDREGTLQLLATLGPASEGEAQAQARAALERATRMRAAGDEAHARLAEGLALEWALLARDEARTATVEKGARATEEGAIEAGARTTRERALLDEAIARSGRLRAELALAKAPHASDHGTERTANVSGGSAPRTLPPRHGAVASAEGPPSPKKTGARGADAPPPPPSDKATDKTGQALP